MRTTPTKYIVSFLVLLLMFLLLLKPHLCIEGATNGLLLWFHKLLPSLFPFILLMQFLSQLNVFFKISHKLTFITQPLLRINGTTFMLFILGLIGGYPMGAKLTKELYLQGKISTTDAKKCLCCANNCGPIFIIGTVGALMLGNTRLGYLLFLVHVLSAVLLLLLTRFFPNSQTSCKISTVSSSLTISEAFTLAVQNAMDTIVYVGGYIIFFSVLIHMLKSSSIVSSIITYFSRTLRIPYASIQSILLGSLEFSNGSALIASTTPFSLMNLALLSALIAFGGFCVLFQSQYVLQGTNLSISLYFTSKCLQAMLAYLLTLLLAPLLGYPFNFHLGYILLFTACISSIIYTFRKIV